MRRREFCAAASGLFVAPFVARAQSGGRVPRVGFVLNSAQLSMMSGPEPVLPQVRGFLHGLRALGYAEGRNISIELRTAEGKLDRLESILRELAHMPVDAIVVTGNAMVIAARKVTRDVPIVVAGMGSPVENGFVSSLARPGGNVTGVVPVFGTELVVKQLELVREILPKAKEVAYLVAKDELRLPGQTVETTGRQLGLTLRYVNISLPAIESGLEPLERKRPDAVLVPSAASLFVHIRTIVEFALKLRLPVFHAFHEATESGALASYGHDSYDIFRRAAGYVDRILKGANPADMPVEQMDRYTLALNLKTAKALAISVPQVVRMRAGKVIE